MRSILTATAISLLATVSVANACRRLDLDERAPIALSGMLGFKVFPGAPNFTDVRSGDQPEPSYILTLDDPVCVTGGDQGSQLSEPIDKVHLTSPFDGSDDTIGGDLRSAKGRHVEVSAKSIDVATTGHHHAPLLAEITSVALVGEGVPGMEQPGTMTVRGFYSALAAGDGAEASKFVVSELRSHGPLSANAMSAYYSTLESPLRLQDVRPLSDNTFEATYTFTSQAGVCNGRSIVSTVQRGNLVLINHIRSLSGC